MPEKMQKTRNDSDHPGLRKRRKPIKNLPNSKLTILTKACYQPHPLQLLPNISYLPYPVLRRGNTRDNQLVSLLVASIIYYGSSQLYSSTTVVTSYYD